MSSLRPPSAAAPLDDDDLLSEILLRLPPQPSSLPRASAVCRRWRSLASDPGFSSRFRRHHRRNPPLLGFFDEFGGLPFLPTLEAPNRVPPGRFSLQRDDVDGGCHTSLGCRHGLFLTLLPKRLQILVWDPVTGDKHRLAIPTAFHRKSAKIDGAVLRADGDVQQHFQVVLAVVDGDDEQHIRALACVYSSKTGLWGNLVSTPIPYQDNGSSFPTIIFRHDAVLAGDSLYWELCGNLTGILEFDLVKQSLAVMPVDTTNRFTIIRADCGGIGFVTVSDCSAELWQRETDCDGGTSWGIRRTIELDKLISARLRVNRPPVILGFAEENNVVLLSTIIGLFLVHLESLKFEKLCEYMPLSCYHPFESVFTAETCARGGHGRAELLLNT
ncbi:unnamed protein product [Alopecurus aequalis]